MRLGSACRRAVAVALAAALALGADALADADPASDVLLLQNAFLPQAPAPSGSVARQLRSVTDAANKAGYPLKVAVIGSPADLGAIPTMFGQPQRYAGFLGQEITGASGRRRQPLLVVMPAGFGTSQAGDGPAKALRALAVDRQGADGLTRTAVSAVERMSAAAGHPVKPGGGSGSSSGAPLIAFVLPVLLLVVVALVVHRRGRGHEDLIAADGEDRSAGAD
jgi:hypothetical protein